MFRRGNLMRRSRNSRKVTHAQLNHIYVVSKFRKLIQTQDLKIVFEDLPICGRLVFKKKSIIVIYFLRILMHFVLYCVL